ncbi:MAG: DUF465 domain-containing protein [Rhodobacteraceae bacterium]|nr:DUF465 domain-containing protein [Paracoccaceae bacterium]
MTLTAHLSELKKKHHSLSVEIERAQRTPGADGLHISMLKKQKLRLKEKIERLSASDPGARNEDRLLTGCSSRQ